MEAVLGEVSIAAAKEFLERILCGKKVDVVDKRTIFSRNNSSERALALARLDLLAYCFDAKKSSSSLADTLRYFLNSYKSHYEWLVKLECHHCHQFSNQTK